MIAIIAAIQENDRGIGYQGNLLYHISDDMKRFKQLTEGNAVIMGRKTWESLPESVRPLPNRMNIVITRNEKYVASGATVAHSLDEALEKAEKESSKNIFIVGGAEIYTKALPAADRLYLTIIDGNRDADAFFPDYSLFTKIIQQEDHKDTRTGIRFQYLTVERAS